MLILAGIFAFFELYPRDYKTEPSSEVSEKWVQSLKDYFSTNPTENELDDAVFEQFLTGSYERAKERVKQNLRINKHKSFFLYRCYLFTCVSFAANLTTLAIRAFF